MPVLFGCVARGDYCDSQHAVPPPATPICDPDEPSGVWCAAYLRSGTRRVDHEEHDSCAFATAEEVVFSLAVDFVGYLALRAANISNLATDSSSLQRAHIRPACGPESL